MSSDDPQTAREAAELILAHLIHYPVERQGCYERDLHYLTAELELWAGRESGPLPAVAKCEWCDWEMSYSAETIIEEATILRQACIDHCREKHPERFNKATTEGKEKT